MEWCSLGVPAQSKCFSVGCEMGEMGGRVGETLAAAAAVGSCSCYESVLHSVPAQQLNSNGQQATGAGGSGGGILKECNTCWRKVGI